MTDAARDQGWVAPDADELARIREELAADDPPVDDEEGLALVEQTRRRLEEARKAQLEDGADPTQQDAEQW